jgi:hypothetical protein
MISLLVSLSLILTPVLPENIPAQLIYLGKGVEPIHSIKVRKGYVVDTTSILLTPFNFIRIKSILEGSPDLCVYAIDQAVQQCQEGIAREQQITLERENNDAEIIAAYESRLKLIEDDLVDTQLKNKILIWSSVSLALLSSISITIAAIK